jgi:hypothetical protein
VTARKIVTIPDVENILHRYNVKVTDQVIKELKNLPPKRKKAEPPPAGCISMNAAGKKYRIHPTTILKWVKKGIIPVIKRTDNCTYVDEKLIKKISNMSRIERHRFIESYDKDKILTSQ